MGRPRKNRQEWYLPRQKKKKPFLVIENGSAASGLLIDVLAEQRHTVASAFNAVNYDPEAKHVLWKYIEAGHLEALLRDVLYPYWPKGCLWAGNTNDYQIKRFNKYHQGKR